MGTRMMHIKYKACGWGEQGPGTGSLGSRSTFPAASHSSHSSARSLGGSVQQLSDTWPKP